MSEASTGPVPAPEVPRPSAPRRLVRRPAVRVPSAEPSAPGRLLRPAASCPRCGARPAMRVTEAMVRALHGAGDEERVGTYQCQRRGCGAIYDLFAGDYLRAS